MVIAQILFSKQASFGNMICPFPCPSYTMDLPKYKKCAKTALTYIGKWNHSTSDAWFFILVVMENGSLCVNSRSKVYIPYKTIQKNDIIISTEYILFSSINKERTVKFLFHLLRRLSRVTKYKNIHFVPVK